MSNGDDYRHVLMLTLAVCTFTTGCKSGPRAIEATFPFEPGTGACTTTIERDGRTGTIRAVRERGLIREVIDLDGDGTPEELRLSKLDAQGRIVEVERWSADGAMLRSRETRTWDGRRLVRRSFDHRDSDGRPAADGTDDEVHTLVWEGERLVREAIDQLDADGLLGVDGEPEFVTTWVFENGKRSVGTQIDVRDDAVLRIDQLSWTGDHLSLHTIDLGGDGEPDTRITNTWDGDRLIATQIDGDLDSAQIRYKYCD